jgi:peptidoglycan/LPS O-acetylase OafA/YrhL
MKNTIPALTGIRYIAAFMIVVEHLVPLCGIPWLDGLHKEMNVGVTIFFVLSGFLISYRYYEDYTASPLIKKSYVVNRIARIFPMYALVTCFTFFFLFHSTNNNRGVLTEFILNITFLRGFSSKYVYTGVSQGWTLSVEEVFYFLAPLIFFWRRRIPLLLQSSIFLACGFVLLYFTGLMSLKGMWICTFFGRSFEFMTGIFLYFIIKNDSFKPKMKMTPIAVVFFVGLVFVMSRLSYPPYEYGIQNPIGLALNNYVMPIVIALLFWGLIKERSGLQKLLSTKVFEVLGKSSYTLYLIHYGTYTYLINKYVSSNIVITILIIQVSAILAWWFIEEPMNKMIRDRFWARTRAKEILSTKAA